MLSRADEIIVKLNLLPHPEGGFYKEVYRADESISHLPDRYGGSRPYSTSIYFLLKQEQKSNFHRLQSDELWFYHEGSPISVYIIDDEGILEVIKLGLNLDNNEIPQAVIKKGSWFAAELNDKTSFCFIGCVVSPGFEFKDFELGKKSELKHLYPEYEELINKFSID